LESEQTITQSVFPECEAITSVFLLNESAYEGNSTLSIEIKDKSSNSIYFTKQISLHNVGKDDFIKINFKNLFMQRMTVYWFKLRTLHRKICSWELLIEMNIPMELCT